VAPAWKEACATHCSELGPIDAETLYDAIEQTREWFWSDPERHRRGRLDLDAAAREVVGLAIGSLGVSHPDAAARIAARYREVRRRGYDPFPGAVDTLRWCRQSGCRLALVSNGGAVTQWSKINRFGLGGLFDAILIEGDLGFGKPDPRIYQKALEALDTPADRAWMVGDHLEFDVAQPQRMGLSGIWVDRSGEGVPAASDVKPDRILRRLADLRTPD
jgi:putative hydrolase of the HAD superfamily